MPMDCGPATGIQRAAGAPLSRPLPHKPHGGEENSTARRQLRLASPSPAQFAG